MSVWSWYTARTEREKWDEQIKLNRSHGDRSAQQIATKMQKCPNNPHNGGQGQYSNLRGEFWDYAVDDESEPKPKKRWWDS